MAVIPLIVGAAAVIGYVTATGEGNPADGLETIGKGEDLINRSLAAGVEQTIKFSMENFPEQTKATLAMLEEAGKLTSETIIYLDDATGNRISKKWGEIPERLQNQIKGAFAAGSAIIPAGSLAKTTKLGKVDTPEVDVDEIVNKDTQIFKEVDNNIKNIIKVDITNVKKGSTEYKILNNPKPNTITELSNGTIFKTGEGGYVDQVTYKPIDSSSVRDSRQTAVGKEGIAGDVGGHIQACRHGGTCDRFNLFPQNSNFNNSGYKRWENEITRSLQNGDNVGNVTVYLNRMDPYNPRPDSVRIEYSLNGEIRVKNFKNEAGQ